MMAWMASRRGRCGSAKRGVLWAWAMVLLLEAAGSWAQAPSGLTEDIQPQPLTDALAAYAKQTSLQLVYVSELARDHTSKGALAGLAPDAALTRLLEGTGLQFEFLNARTVRILAGSDRRYPPVRAPRPEHGAKAPTSALEEVLVTATKREEAARDVPISMSVWTQEGMDASGVKDLTDLAALTPGIYYSSYSTRGPGYISSVVMRGISDTGVEATTGIYLDDIPMHGRTVATGQGDILPVTFDLDRVEVLRGPQGTLGGDANSGGAIHFITNQPSLTEWSGLARGEGASTSRGGMSYEAGVAAGGPIVPEKLGFRLSVWTRRDGGYVDRVNPFTGATVDADANRSLADSIRAAFTIASARGVQITPAITYQLMRLHDSPFFYTYLSDPGAGVLRSGKLLQQPYDDEFYLASVKITADLHGTQLTAVTAYSYRTVLLIQDATNFLGAYNGGWGNRLGDAFPTSYLNAVPAHVYSAERALSQELRLASSDPKARLTWIAGTWFARSMEDHRYVALSPPLDPRKVASDYYQYDAGSTMQIDGFGKLDLRLAHGLTSSLGVRVGYSRYRLQDAEGPTSNPAPYVFHARQIAVTPRFELSYAPDQYSLIYLTIAKGYQLGGVNFPPMTPCGAAFPSSYGPDTVWSYELGAKERLLGGRVQLDASLFHLLWRNMQQFFYSSACQQALFTNVGSAASNGFDLSGQVAVTDRMRLAAQVEYADARYTDTRRLGDGTIIYKGAVVGGLPLVAPPWSGNVWAEFDVFRSAQATVSARVEDAIRSHNPGPFAGGITLTSGNGLTADPATNLCNARLRFVWASYEVAAFINNVFDSQPTLNRAPDVDLSKLAYAATFRPRTFGIAGNVRF